MRRAWLFLVLSAWPAWARAQAIPALDKIFKDNEVAEVVLHASQPPAIDHLGGAEADPKLQGFIPSCGGEDEYPGLPARYLKDYKIPPADQRKLGEVLQGLSAYKDVRKAIKDGYRVGEEYEAGAGIAFSRPDSITDRQVDLAKPDILLYVKARDRQAYMLVGATFLAGDKKPQPLFRVGKADSNKVVSQWRQWNKLCWRFPQGQALFEEVSGPADCSGGTFFPTVWALHLWLPLYNPNGLFTPRNAVVDYIDLKGKFPPFCR